MKPHSLIYLIAILLLIGCSKDDGILSKEFDLVSKVDAPVSVDVDGDGQDDIQFEVINIEILDSSTFGYPEALTRGYLINKSNHYSILESFALGNQFNTGMFQGNGIGYLGFRKKSKDDFQYGWIGLVSTQDNQTIVITKSSINTVVNKAILAGQEE